MPKRFLLSVLAGMICLAATACSVEKVSEEKLKDLEYTVVASDEIPEELMTQIEEEKKEPMTLTYGDKGYLYIAKGYGAQETSGYSIEMKELYETENSICIKTELLGPDKSEQILEKETYPYIVVKIEENEKYVVFQ